MFRLKSRPLKFDVFKTAALLALLVFPLVAPIFAQNKNGAGKVFTLESNKPIDGELTNDWETHGYRIKLAAGQYAKIIVEQREVDVAAQLYAPDGVLITKYDYEPRLKEREEIGFVAEKAGEYRLDVRAKYKNSAGRYEISWAETRAATERDRALYEAHILSIKAEDFDLVGKYSDALSSAARALEIGEKSLDKDDAYLGYLLNRLGAAQRRKGDYATAEATLQRALAVNEKASGAENPRTVDTLRYLGLVYLATDEFAKSDKMFSQALATTEKTLGAEHPRIAVQLLGLLTLRFYLGDNAQAEKYGQRALAIAEKRFEPENVVMTYILNNLATIYQTNGDYERAEPILRRVLAIYERTIGTENNDYALTLQSLGNNLRRRKDYAQSLAVYERALAIREKTLGKDHLNIAPLLINISGIHSETGDYAKALEAQKAALAVAEKSGGLYHEYTLTSLDRIAGTYAALNDAADALAFYTLAEERSETALALNLAIGSERQKLIQLDLTTKKTSRSISMNVNLAPDDSKAAALAALLILQRKGRVLDAMSDAFAALRSRAGAEDKKLLDELNSIVEQLAEAALDKSSKTTLDEQREQIAALTEKKENLEAEISRRRAEFRAVSQTVTLDSVRAQIPTDAALVEYAVYRPFNPRAQQGNEAYDKPHYIAYIIRRTGDVRWKEIGDAETIDKMIDEWRAALRDAKSKDVAALARAMDEKIMQPVRSVSGDAKQLLVSPDGALNLIPFEALVDEQNRYLVENYSFTYLTSGRDLLRMQTTQASKSKSLIVANPTFGEPLTTGQIAKNNTERKASGKATRRRSTTAARALSETFFAPLAGTIREARDIQTVFPDAASLTGAQATETALKQTNAPRLLHIATHGFFLQNTDPAAAANDDAKPENPLLRSGLALTGANERKTGAGDDGILTALEAANLNLWGTKLVVLSACDTGLGEVKNGEGVYGLRRAFTLAGAESQVMSLWAVSDYATRELMTDYYKNLKQGMGRGAALRKVQLEMLKKKGREHPFYWAAFIQSGEWANLEGKR